MVNALKINSLRDSGFESRPLPPAAPNFTSTLHKYPLHCRPHGEANENACVMKNAMLRCLAFTLDSAVYLDVV